MGGLMSTLKPQAPKAASPAAVSSPADDQAAAEKANRQRRLDAMARQRSGRAGTIATSDRGLLVPVEWTPQRKSLLGE